MKGTVRVFENLRVLPRAFVVPRSGVEVEPDENRAMTRLVLPTFDPAVSVLLPEAPAWPAAGAGAPAADNGAEIVSLSVNEVRVAARASTDAVLVFTDIHYPGWRVWVDGREAPLLRTDYAFKGVALGPGAHDVRFAFVPWRYRVGGLISCATLLFLAGVVVVDRRRRLRHSRRSQMLPPEFRAQSGIAP